MKHFSDRIRTRKTSPPINSNILNANGTVVYFFQKEGGIRDSVASRGLGDVYKRRVQILDHFSDSGEAPSEAFCAVESGPTNRKLRGWKQGEPLWSPKILTQNLNAWSFQMLSLIYIKRCRRQSNRRSSIVTFFCIQNMCLHICASDRAWRT